MNIAFGIVAALATLGVGSFALFAAWGWFLEFCDGPTRFGGALWMAGSLSVFLPLAIALLFAVFFTFYLVSGVRPS